MTQPDDYSEYNVILWTRNGNIVHYPVWFLNFDFLENDFEAILFLKFEPGHQMEQLSIPATVYQLDAIFMDHPHSFILLTPWKASPLHEDSADEMIYSFACNFHLFKNLLNSLGKNEFRAANFLFELLDVVLSKPSGFNKIFARQLPIQITPSCVSYPCDVIVPHKGNDSYLAKLLDFLAPLTQLNAYVGLDEQVTPRMNLMRKRYEQVTFYSFSPNPVGPYVIRNTLIDRSSSPFIFFQDSDDISCADRFEKLTQLMIEQDCMLCGSHEIRMDYYDKRVQAIRYPKNVIHALAESAEHALLHGASAIRRTAFYAGGKLSEERIFGNDTKFLLHSFFLFNNIQNADEFLYIRRKRPDSLTTSTHDQTGFQVRYRLWCEWSSDFELIKAGQLKLEDSSLTYKKSALSFEVNKL